MFRGIWRSRTKEKRQKELEKRPKITKKTRKQRYSSHWWAKTWHLDRYALIVHKHELVT
jgi:hypothetical protein